MPDRTYFTGGVVAHGKDKVELRRPGCENSSQLLLRRPSTLWPLLSKPFQCSRNDFSRWFAARTVGFKFAFAQCIEQHFAQNAARGIAGTQHQHVVNLFLQDTLLNESLFF